MVKYPPDNAGARGFNPWVGKIPWREKWQSTPVFLPEKKQTNKHKNIHKRSQKSQTQPSMDVQYATRDKSKYVIYSSYQHLGENTNQTERKCEELNKSNSSILKN